MKSLIERLDDIISIYDTLHDILLNALRDVKYLMNQIRQRIEMRKIKYKYGGSNTYSSYGHDTNDDVDVNDDGVKKGNINDDDNIGDTLFEGIADTASDDSGDVFIDVNTIYLKTCKVLYDVKYSYDEVREKLWLIADDCIIIPSIFDEIERVFYFILDKPLKNMNGLVSRYKQNIKSKIDEQMMHLRNMTMTMTTDASSSCSSSSSIDATSSSSGIKGWWNQLTETWLTCSFSDVCNKCINIVTFDGGKGDGGGNDNGNDGKSMGLIRSSIQNALYPNMKVELIEESIITTLLEIEPLIQDLILSSSLVSSSAIATHRLQSTHDHIELLLCKVILFSPNSKMLSTYIHQDTYHHNRAIQALSKHWLHLEHEVMNYHHLSTQELENLNNILINKGTINHDIGLINVIDYIITNKLVSSSIQNTINTIQQLISYRNGLYSSIHHSITILKQLYHRAKHTEEFLNVGIHRIRVGKKFTSNEININKDNINNNNNELTKDKLNNMERLMKAILVKQQHTSNNHNNNNNKNDDNNDIFDHKEYSPSKDSFVSSPNYKRMPPFNPDSHPSERIFRPQPSTSSSHNQQGSIFPRSSSSSNLLRPRSASSIVNRIRESTHSLSHELFHPATFSKEDRFRLNSMQKVGCCAFIWFIMKCSSSSVVWWCVV